MSSKCCSSLLAFAFAFALAGCGSDEVPTSNQVKAPGQCVLDGIDGQTTPVVRVKQADTLFRGWMVGSANASQHDKLTVEIKAVSGKTYAFESPERVARPDVARALKNDGYLMSGFKVNADLSGLDKGTYGISVRLHESDGVLVCRLKRNLVIE